MKINQMINKCKFQINKKSPEILVGVGVVGVVTSCVLACKATTKIDSVMDEYRRVEENIEKVLSGETPIEVYTKADAENDLRIMRVKTAVNLAKLYAPSIILGGVSLGCIIKSHGILKNRYNAISAAYMTIDGSYKAYRNRVVERFGADVDKELKYGMKVEEITDTTVDENGNEVTTTAEYKTMYDLGYSEYARFFDESCIAWQKDPSYNLTFLRAQQAYANDLLKARGVLFLNEVYDMLDIPRSKAGQVVGWKYDPVNGKGDNYVDFGIYDLTRERVRAFINGDEPNILLDFNVDGNVWELM